MSQSPRLLIAAGIFHPEAGGPATYLHALLPALIERGWQPQVITYGDAPTDGYPYPLVRVPRRVLPIRIAEYGWRSRALAARADLIYAHTIDLPVAWGDAPRLIKIVGDQAWERCIRRGWVTPTTDIDAFQTGDYGRVVAAQRRSRAEQVRAFDGVIVPSAYLRQMVIGWGVPPERVHVIYNALQLADADLAANQAAARAQLGWDDRPTLLTAARLNPWKGVDHLLTALHALPDVRLVVAGDGPELARLRQQAEPLAGRVTFLGRVPRRDLYLMMQAADYVALYSGYEGLPHVLLEALHAGTPVIASDKGGNPEVVHDGVNGLLAPYVDIDGLAAVLERAFAAGTREQLAANVQHGMERFDFAAMVSATDRVLRDYLR